ncbi:MAG: ABC transporter substrate-binding protein [Promethearchaeota archaeon]
MRKKTSILGVCLTFIFVLNMGTHNMNAIKVYYPDQLLRYPWGNATASMENPFTSLAFRQAIAMAFDYNAFLTDIVGETGFRLEGMIPLGMFGHHDTLLEEDILPTYQPDAAKALFDAVGWTGTIVLSFNIGDNIRENVCLNLKTSIEAMGVGIAIDVQGVTWPDFLSMINQGSLPVFVLGWGPDYADPDNYVGSFFHSEQGYFAPMTGYANPALDAMLVQAARETDVAVREQLYLDIEEMAVRDMTWLYLYQRQVQSYPRVWLEGVEEAGVFNPMLSYMSQLWAINKTTGSTNSSQDTFVWETSGWVDPLDTAYNYENFGRNVNALTRETLLQYRYENTTLYPALATSYEISHDARNITFHLRHGVTYHDGSPFNAYTMKYSIDRAIIFNDYPRGPVWMITPNLLGGDYFYIENPNVSDAIEYLNAGGVQALDEYTLRICQEMPYVPMLHALQHPVCAAISPKDVIENIPSDYVADATDDDFGMISLTGWFPDLTETEIRTYLGIAADANLNVSGVVPGSHAEGETAHDYMNTWAIGTGPYKMVTFNQTNRLMEFEKNTNWWNAANFAPLAVDYVRIYGEMNNETTRIQDLLTGNCDVTKVSVMNFDLVRNSTTGVPTTGLQHFEKPTFHITFAGFNIFDEGPAEFMIFNGSTTTPPPPPPPPPQYTTITETTTEYSSIANSTRTITKYSDIAGSTELTTDYHTITITKQGPVPGFELVFFLSCLSLISVIVQFHKRKKRGKIDSGVM